MEFHLRIQGKENFEWLETLITNTLEDPNHNTTRVAYSHLAEWDKAFKICRSERENNNVDDSSESKITKTEAPSKPNKTTRKRKTRTKLDKSGLVCNQHTTYTGQRSPRRDCKECWAVYKRFHPEEYDVKRRVFLTKQRMKAKSAS